MLGRIFNLNAGSSKTLTRKQHQIRPEDTSLGAREIVAHLQSNGYEAFMVGGCLRDLIAGIKPKDFDVATNATPEQVVKLFPRAHIIGRRFRIVHVHRGRELIEVTTFRAHHTQGRGNQGQQSISGMLVRDNVFGDISDDAVRRDFTCNSLYYDPSKQIVIDMCDGLTDLRKGILRTIGDPFERFREDPVRMIRAIRFEAKLGLKLDADSRDALHLNRGMLAEVAPARLFDEIVKLLMTDSATAAWDRLCETGMLAPLFPETAEQLEKHPEESEMIRLAMQNTVDRIKSDKRVAPFFLYAVLLWPQVKNHWYELQERGLSAAEAMSQAAELAIYRQCVRIAIPRRISDPMKEIWELQISLCNTSPTRAMRLASHPRFRAAYDFLLLREGAGEDTGHLGDWWTDFQKTLPADHSSVSRRPPERTSDSQRRRRKPRKRKPSNDS